MKVRKPLKSHAARVSVGNVCELEAAPKPNVLYVEACGPLACPLSYSSTTNVVAVHNAMCGIVEAMMADRDADVADAISRTHAVLKLAHPSLLTEINSGGGISAVPELTSCDAAQSTMDALQPACDHANAGKHVRLVCSCRPKLARCHCDAFARFIVLNI